MDKFNQILKNSRLTAEKIEANLIHPVLNTTDYKPREFFSEITDITDNYFCNKSAIRMVGLAGLRGVGKTTLLWQTADYIFKNYTQNIYFFHIGRLKKFDIGISEIHEAIEKYITNGQLWSYKEKIVLLFDEIHEDQEWASSLKNLYDLFRPMFVIATGSSALLLQSTADLVTRMLIQHIYPLNFREYIGFTQPNTQKISNTSKKLKDILFKSENIESLFKNLQIIHNEMDSYLNKIDNIENSISNYIAYHNITRFSLEQNKERIDSLISDLIRRVIYEDIPKLSQSKTNPRHSEKILSRIAASDEVNIQSLSQSIGISQTEINESLDILEKAELLNMLYPFGGIDSKINKMKKYFFMSPSIRQTILSPLSSDETDIYAKMLEDTVVLYLKRIFKDKNIISFTSAKAQKNPDLVIESLPLPIIMEIGIGKRKLQQITKSKIKYKYGIIINSTDNDITINKEDKVLILPLKYFLLT